MKPGFWMMEEAAPLSVGNALAVLIPGPVVGTRVWLHQPLAVDLRVVLGLPRVEGQVLLGHGGVHVVAVHRDVFPGKQDLVLAVLRHPRALLQVEAAFVTTCTPHRTREAT